MELVVQELSLDHAEAEARALDLYSRILSGRLGEIANLAADGRLGPREGREPLSPGQVARLRALMDEARAVLGYGRGEGGGLGPAAHPDANLSYEVHAVVRRCLAEAKGTAGDGSRVDGDGLPVRYASGPAPTARLA